MKKNKIMKTNSTLLTNKARKGFKIYATIIMCLAICLKMSDRVVKEMMGL